MIAVVSSNPWTPYAQQNPGHGKGHPVVPEPACYGALLALVCVALWAQRVNR